MGVRYLHMICYVKMLDVARIPLASRQGGPARAGRWLLSHHTGRIMLMHKAFREKYDELVVFFGTILKRNKAVSKYKGCIVQAQPIGSNNPTTVPHRLQGRLALEEKKKFSLLLYLPNHILPEWVYTYCIFFPFFLKRKKINFYIKHPICIFRFSCMYKYNIFTCIALCKRSKTAWIYFFGFFLRNDQKKNQKNLVL